MIFVWGCSHARRDYYQAPPPEPAAIRVTSTMSQDLFPIALTALDREGLTLGAVDVVSELLLGEIMGEGQRAGQLLLVRHNPESPESVAIEVRYGRFGNPREEGRLADALATSFASVTESDESLPIEHSSRTTKDLAGRWIDLEPAVAQAGKTKQSVEFAVVGVDRWRYATFFDVRTLAGAEGRLTVIGDRESATGPRAAWVRLGRFGDPQAEADLLDRVQTALTELRRMQRLPGAR